MCRLLSGSTHSRSIEGMRKRLRSVAPSLSKLKLHAPGTICEDQLRPD